MNGKWALLFTLGLATAAPGRATAAGAAFATGRYPDLFQSLLGRSDREVDAKIQAAWHQLFYGRDDTQRVYFPVGGDMAYIADIGHHDVRTEGMSYGMMIAVQLDRREEFDRLWQWARTHMYHADGPWRGYFAWHCAYEGRQLSAGPAPDGEEWFAMALFFAAGRWGNGRGIFNYQAEAEALLRTMARPDTGMFSHAVHQIVFSPNGIARDFTDPSYQLPAFYELWSRWAPDGREFWAQAAAASRALFKKAANSRTGLMPNLANFDGTPRARDGDFGYDAWRTLANVALDHAWFAADPWEITQSNRVLTFLAQQGPDYPGLFALDGKPLTAATGRGLEAMAAVAGLAADPARARPFVQRLWDMPIPDGEWRYYDGMLYLLALLQAGGRFRIYAPAPGR